MRQSEDQSKVLTGGVRLIFLFVCVFASLPAAFGGVSSDGIWLDIVQPQATADGAQVQGPPDFRLLQVASVELEELLRSAPPERSGHGISMALPMPDGSFQQFVIVNSPVMEASQTQSFQGMSTFSAVAKDNAAVTARLDLTPAGFHAIVFRAEGTVYIDPYQHGGEHQYLSYYSHDVSQNEEPLQCSVARIESHNPVLQGSVPGGAQGSTPVGPTLRTYRIAVAATGEYTQLLGGSAGDGLAGIVTTINRVTAIFERDLSVRLLLVANNHLLVYTDPATDPYTNGNSSAMRAENQVNLDLVIGTGNYDIGHLLGMGGLSQAPVGVVCNSDHKGAAQTSRHPSSPESVAIGIVVHEIGHQFGGDHTFNGTTDGCNLNRSPSSAYEPASGTTILSYAGICGDENIQASRDHYFHTQSLEQMLTHVTDEATCSVNSATGNTAPAVDAGSSHTVPADTPLVLRATPAIDPDSGQKLSYNWEQFDLGAASPPSTDDGSRPIFRSFPPAESTVRYLPQMSDILSGASTLGESLPSTDRPLTFRLTVRDNAPAGGGMDYSSVSHQVDATAGPFRVTSQSTATTWVPGSIETVTWDVARTDESPVKCDQVSVLFSDSGFPGFTATTLLAGTSNDGSETISVPVVETEAGRVMVWCDSNIFFDVNDAPITVHTDCGNSILDAGELCDDANLNDGDGCSSFCQVEAGSTCSQPVPAVTGVNALPEGGFEGGTPNPAWTEFSANFGTPLCDKTLCGESGVPNMGEWFVWFGGSPVPETASVEQTFVIEETDKELSFARRLRACNFADDVIRLKIDGSEVWLKEDNDPDCGELSYQMETIDLEKAPGGPYNDGKSHLIRFEAATYAVNGGASNFDLDDVSILRGAVPAKPSVCSAGLIHKDGFE